MSTTGKLKNVPPTMKVRNAGNNSKQCISSSFSSSLSASHSSRRKIPHRRQCLLSPLLLSLFNSCFCCVFNIRLKRDPDLFRAGSRYCSCHAAAIADGYHRTTGSSSSSIPSSMKAVVVKETGDASALTYFTDHPTPELKPGQVLVRNEYAGINFIDTYHRGGLYPRDLPFIAGQEGGGTVAAASDEAASEGIAVGDRVAYSVFGSYAEYTAVPLDKLVPVPEGVTMDLAVACIVQGLTAHYLTSSAHADLIKPGEWCLIYSVGSGTCQWAAQMAKIRGYKVIGTCSKSKEALAKEAGCDELIVLESNPGASYANYESVDIVSRVMEITGGKGVKCVIDGVGKSTVDYSINALGVRGIFISFGNASGAAPPFSVLRLLAKSAYVTRPKLNDYVATREALIQRSDQVFKWLKDGKLRIRVDSVFPLEEAPEGHRYLESGKSKGKLLYKV